MTEIDPGGAMILLGFGWGVGTFLGYPGVGVAIISGLMWIVYASSVTG